MVTTGSKREGLYPGEHVIRPGLPLVIVEGALEVLLLGQELDGLASVVTLGSASSRPTHDDFWAGVVAPSWFIATDADGPGDTAAVHWLAAAPYAKRVRPPGGAKDGYRAALRAF